MERPTLVPELYVSDLAASLRFYVENLGFAVAYARPEERFACVVLGGAWLMLEQTPGLGAADREAFESGQWRTAPLERPFGRGLNLEVTVPDLRAIEERLRRAGITPKLPAHERRYRVNDEERHLRQLLVEDPDGYLIRPSQVLSDAR